MTGLLVAMLCIALNGFFVSAEFALVKVRATQVRSRAREGDKAALAAEQVISRLERYLSVTQFGITLASLGLGWIGEPAVAELIFRGVAVFVPGPLARPVTLAVAVVAFMILTFAHVLFGELLPKLVAIQRSESVTLFSARPLRFIYYSFKPLLWTLEAASRVILSLFGLQASISGEGQLSEEEIVGILALNAAQSPGGKAKGELVERVIRFSQRTARHSMVPRVDVVSLPIDATVLQAIEVLKVHQFSRIILTRARALDDVAGYLYGKDLFIQQELDVSQSLTKFCREILFVPEVQSGIDVIREMQRTHTPIAIVVDEYGGTSGIVTMEDLLEEIVGEIKDELDGEELPRIMKVDGSPDTWDVDGRAAMDELRPLGVRVTEEDLGEPVGAWVLQHLGHLPRLGDSVSISESASAEVTAIRRRRVTAVRVRKVAPPSSRNISIPEE